MVTERTGAAGGRRRLFWIVLVTGVVLVLEGLSGLYRRWYVGGISGYGFPKGLFVVDEDLGFRLTPGFAGSFTRDYSDIGIRVNDDGFRDDPFEPPSNGLRVALLGDSIVFGVGVSAADRMDARLEQALPARAGPTTVLNLGVYGYSLGQYVTLLRRIVPDLRPHAIVVGFAVNDIKEEGVDWAPGPAPGLRAAVKRASNVAWLLAHVRHRWVQRDSRANLRNAERYWRAYCEEVVARWSRPEDLSVLERNLDRLAALASAPGAPPLRVVVWPTSFELEEPEGDWDVPRVRLRRGLADRGIPCRDLYEDFAVAGPAEELFLEGDPMHFSPAGHRVAAAALAEEVASMLVDGPADESPRGDD